jgi:tRNA nucleotidyltransferase (CCA-adding enzyme)
VWALSVNTAVRDKVATYARTWRHVRPLLDGNAVQQMGLQGKQIGDALRALRAARLDGKVESADDERDFIRQLG